MLAILQGLIIATVIAQAISNYDGGAAVDLSSQVHAVNAAPKKLPSVLFVNHGSRLGGAELVLLDVVRSFAEHSSVLLFEDGPLRCRLEQLGLRTAMLRHSRDLTYIKRDRSLLRALPMLCGMMSMIWEIASAARTHDLVYANSQKAFVLSAIAAALARRPLVWHLHDIPTPDHFGQSQIKLTRVLANHFAARVIVPSTAVWAGFVAAGGRQSMIRLVPNGVTLGPVETDRAALRARLGVPSGFVFGVFSRLAPWKGQIVALQALARLPHVHCLIVGSALFGEEGYAQELHRLAGTLGVAQRAHFLGWRDDVPALMQAVDVVVHPSVAPEPFGRTLVEAMLSRTPIVAATAGAVSEILEDGAAGFMVPPQDAVALATMLEKLRTQPEITAAVTDHAEERARKVFSAGSMQSRIEAVTREVMARECPEPVQKFGVRRQ